VVPIFGTTFKGRGILPASIVLAIMILPTISAISRDALAAVPPKIREAAYGLGATRWEALLGVIIPTASTGIFGSIILGFGRALGETMALAMLVGNSSTIDISLFASANTLAALLANNFPEANSAMAVARLMYAALALLAITMVVNVAGTWIVNRANAKREGLR
jgi:phosphate transport system permease protein